VDEIVVFDRARGLTAFADVARELAKRRFDLVINLQVYFKAGIVTALTRSPIKLGFDRARARDLNWLFTTHRIPPHPPQHVQDQYFEFLDAMAIRHGEAAWNLVPTSEERATAAALLGGRPRPVVGLVVGTSKPAKNWPAARYAELAMRLDRELGATVVLLGGTSSVEQAAAATILSATDRPVNALGSGIRGLVGLLAACDVVVSPDTGPYHMCVAMNVPAVGLYGYTNPKRVGPYRRFRNLVIDAYGDPGEDYPVSMEYRYDRMERIGVAEVFDKVRLALNS